MVPLQTYQNEIQLLYIIDFHCQFYKTSIGAAKGKLDKKRPGKGSAKSKPAPPPTLSKTPIPADKASDMASDTKSVASETDSELVAEGIIPVAKQAVIGQWEYSFSSFIWMLRF